MKKIKIILFLLISMYAYGTNKEKEVKQIVEFRNPALIDIDSSGKKPGFNAELEKYLNEMGRDTKFIFVLGNEYFLLGKYEKAFKVFSKGTSYLPNLFGAATTARLMGNYQVAVEYYDRMIDGNSGMDEAFLGRGLAHRGLKNYGLAVSDLTRYLGIKRDERAYLGIGGILIETEDYEGALNILQRGRAAFPSSREISNMLSKVAAKMN
ncbi:MAG: hypothetical protein LBT51_07985 [Fusobacteriaceae bacterium]|jgi:tetratricopeptide (TPR) repeat protein|nr:hypothetical protein [Fusobacteriaceae bacterium]